MQRYVNKTIIISIVCILLLGYFFYLGFKTSGLKDLSAQAYLTPKVLSQNDIYNKTGLFIATTTSKIKIAFTGDQGISTSTLQGLSLIREEKAEALVVLGDFEYTDNPGLWLKNLDTYLGVYFPVFAVAGNHEEKAWDRYHQVVKEKINQLPRDMCVSESESDIGLHYTCQIGPLYAVFASPDIKVPSAKKVDSATFIKQAFEKLKKNPIGWNICAWHKVHTEMQLGNKADKITWDIYEACRKEGSYILTSHDHVYARSKTVFDFPKKIVSTTTNAVLLKNGSNGSAGVAILGLGGMSIRPRLRQGDNWWANTYTKEKLYIETDGKEDNTAGILFCTFDIGLDTAPCYFKTIDGVVRDEFILKK